MDFHFKVAQIRGETCFLGTYGQIFGNLPKKFRACGAKMLGGLTFGLGPPPPRSENIYICLCMY